MPTAKHQTPYTAAQIDLALRKALSRYEACTHATDSAVVTPIALADTYYPVAVPTALHKPSDSFTGSDSRLVFTVAETQKFLVTIDLTIEAPKSNEEVRSRIGVNGTSIMRTSRRSKVLGNLNAVRTVSFSMDAVVTLTQNDYIEAFIGNWTDASDLTVVNLQITAIEL